MIDVEIFIHEDMMKDTTRVEVVIYRIDLYNSSVVTYKEDAFQPIASYSKKIQHSIITEINNGLLYHLSDLDYVIELIIKNVTSKMSGAEYSNMQIQYVTKKIHNQLKVNSKASGYSISYSPAPSVNKQNSTNEFAKLSEQLPGIKTEVAFPCDCVSRMYDPKADQYVEYPHIIKKGLIHAVIMHLNDQHKWSREKIADWLDELHDTGQVDIAFKVEVGGEE